MLLITRKAGEGVIVGGMVRIVLVEVRGNRVKLGFEAPARVSILREELCDETRHAAHAQPHEERRSGPDESPYFAECP